MTAPASFLEDVVELLERSRRRTPIEAPWELTKAYAQLLIAVGFARIGRPERARELAAQAEAVLVPMCKRERFAGELPVHSYLVDVFRERFANAVAHRPQAAWLTRRLLGVHDALDRVARYKVDRLGELTSTVSPHGRIGSFDAVSSWMRRTGELMKLEPSTVDRIRELEPAARAERIVGALAEAKSGEELALFAAFAELPSEAADPLLPLLVARAVESPATVRATAYLVATRYGQPELATPFLESALSEVQATPDAVGILRPILRAQRWLHATWEVLSLLERLWAALPTDQLPARIIVAAGLTEAPNDLRLSELFDQQLDVSSREVLPTGLQRARILAGVATYADPVHARELLRRLAQRQWPETYDSYGTNTHYCVSVLAFIDSLVVAYGDLALANLDVHDPEQQALLGSGFAF